MRDQDKTKAQLIEELTLLRVQAGVGQRHGVEDSSGSDICDGSFQHPLSFEVHVEGQSVLGGLGDFPMLM